MNLCLMHAPGHACWSLLTISGTLFRFSFSSHCRPSTTRVKGACRRQKPACFGSIGSGRVNLRRKCVRSDLLCFCMQPLAEIRIFSRHPESANPEFLDFGSKCTYLGQNPSYLSFYRISGLIITSTSPERLFASV